MRVRWNQPNNVVRVGPHNSLEEREGICAKDDDWGEGDLLKKGSGEAKGVRRKCYLYKHPFNWEREKSLGRQVHLEAALRKEVQIEAGPGFVDF